MTRIKVKVCLVGEMAVGKSSLIRRYVRHVAGTPVVVIAANKADLVHDSRIEGTEIARLAESMGAPWLATSAKSGENIEELFRQLAERVLATTLARQPGAGANEPPTMTV